MTIDETIEQIARYREWIERQPFGAPVDTEAYRRQLETDQAFDIVREVAKEIASDKS